jgi:PD-(D/E)XK nuclease superfamily
MGGYLSYSGHKIYLECKRQYYHRYIDRTPIPVPDNRVHMLYGDTVGKIFEAFYTNKLWKAADILKALLRLIPPTLQRVITTELKKGGVFNWKEKGLKKGTRSIQEVEGEIIEAIPRGLSIIKQYRLLSPDAKAELVLDTTLEGHKIAGRADFVMHRIAPHNDFVILDGKGSRWRDKFAHTRQLRWYALQHRIKFGTVPDKLAFIYWRYEPHEAIDWYEPTSKDLDDLSHTVVHDLEEIEHGRHQILTGANPLQVFPANPGRDCVRCSYLKVCPEGTRAVETDKDLIKADMERGVDNGEFSFE